MQKLKIEKESLVERKWKEHVRRMKEYTREMQEKYRRSVGCVVRETKLYRKTIKENL